MVGKIFLAVATVFGLGLSIGPTLAASSTIPGTGAVAGAVTAPQPFTAAHVYLYNSEKRVTFMVYTAGGKYQAINLYPGDYEVRAARRGLASDPQKITVKAGETLNLDLALKDIGPEPKAGINGPSTVVAYPGRVTIVDKDVEFIKGASIGSRRLERRDRHDEQAGERNGYVGP
jgi:Carboxypeptidase regulatory-like domain